MTERTNARSVIIARCPHCLDRGCGRCEPAALSRRSFFFFGAILAARPVLVVPEPVIVPEWSVVLSVREMGVFVDQFNKAKLISSEWISKTPKGWTYMEMALKSPRMVTVAHG